MTKKIGKYVYYITFIKSRPFTFIKDRSCHKGICTYVQFYHWVINKFHHFFSLHHNILFFKRLYLQGITEKVSKGGARLKGGGTMCRKIAFLVKSLTKVPQEGGGGKGRVTLPISTKL